MASLDLKIKERGKRNIGENKREHEEDRKENTVLKSQRRRAFQGGFFLFTPLCYTKS